MNIHPAKREVKFHREKAVRQLLGQAVRETLLKFHGVPATETVAVQAKAPAAAPSLPCPVMNRRIYRLFREH